MKRTPVWLNQVLSVGSLDALMHEWRGAVKGETDETVQQKTDSAAYRTAKVKTHSTPT